MTQNSPLHAHADSLFVRNQKGDLTFVNDWQGNHEAPLLHVARGQTETVHYFHQSVPDAIRTEIRGLLNQENGPITAALSFESEYLRLLGDIREVVPPRLGPAYFILPQEPAVAAPVVAITSTNSHFLERHLSDWLPDVNHEQPMFAWVDDGAALGVCSSVRTSSQAVAAGVEVTPGARKSGIGKAVVRAWAIAVQNSGKFAMYSTTRDNIASQRLAASLKCQFIGTDFSVSAAKHSL